MALKVKGNGEVIIKSEKDAAEALEAFRRLQDEIKELRAESGLDELEKDAVAYKAAAQNYMKTNGIKQIQCRGFHGTLIEGFYGSHWIATPDDMTADALLGAKNRNIVPLQTIIEKKFKSKVTDKGSKARKMWMKITKRVVDQNAIDELVQAGKLKVDEISPAWVEKEKAPYLRLFDDG